MIEPTLKIQQHDTLLELEVMEFGAATTPAQGDVLLSVTVRTGRYAASDHSWVIRTDLDRFLRELHALDHRRQGKATLLSPSPDGLLLEFYSTDSAGHMALRGQLGRTDPDGFLSQLRFGFAFEPDNLPSIRAYFETICRK
jgi:hypothetical protein